MGKVVAISGKGGVGKTTLAAILAKLYSGDGREVILVDADPNPNLAFALGIDENLIQNIRPISEMKDLIQERTGVRPGSMGGIFRLNPFVDDLLDRFAIRWDNMRLLIMGGVKRGGGGCFCPENTLLKALMDSILLQAKDILILDMEAGIEHLGRATTKGVDLFLVLVEPSLKSLSTAKTIKRMAGEIGIERVFIVINKLRNKEDEDLIKQALFEFEIIGSIHYNETLIEAELKGGPVFNTKVITKEVEVLKERLDNLI